jgi:cytochrome c
MDVKINPVLLFVAFLLPAPGSIAVAAGDPVRGARAFQACASCHSVKSDEHMTGPSLANIWNRRAGTVEGFLRYSDAMKRSNIVWTENTLDEWLRDPQHLIPETSMSFPGLRKIEDREDVIAYLKAVSEGKAPAAEQQRGGMMGGTKIDLKKAPSQALVASISYCRNTYIVQTVAGTTHKFWEFNLRFKTDSGNYGPHAGKPVIVGAGMQGDRALVVFAAPGEISGFIKQACK